VEYQGGSHTYMLLTIRQCNLCEALQFQKYNRSYVCCCRHSAVPGGLLLWPLPYPWCMSLLAVGPVHPVQVLGIPRHCQAQVEPDPGAASVQVGWGGGGSLVLTREEVRKGGQMRQGLSHPAQRRVLALRLVRHLHLHVHRVCAGTQAWGRQCCGWHMTWSAPRGAWTSR
jgi:hypothetical protein